MTTPNEKPGPSMKKFRRGMSKVFRGSKGKPLTEDEEPSAPPPSTKADEVKEAAPTSADASKPEPLVDEPPVAPPAPPPDTDDMSAQPGATEDAAAAEAKEDQPADGEETALPSSDETPSAQDPTMVQPETDIGSSPGFLAALCGVCHDPGDETEERSMTNAPDQNST